MDRKNAPREDTLKIGKLLFPNITNKPGDIWRKYPPRNLPSTAWVTRFAPSPTGFVHIGGIFSTLVSRKVAHQTGGLFYLRIEDTDKKREVKNGTEEIVRNLVNFSLPPDEGPIKWDPIVEVGDYGPYIQSDRRSIYETFTKDLVERGLAYPCFCTEAEIEAIRERQKAANVKPGYYGHWAKCRNLAQEEVDSAISRAQSFVIRLRSPYPTNERVTVEDTIRGIIDLPANDQDVVLLKTNSLPTYHLAHAIDDSLMYTNLVVRGEEWIPSLPLHVQLFKAINQQVPYYAHIAPIAKMDGSSRRKLSKRKDPEAAMNYYAEKGYPPQAIIEYLLNLANSDFEEWRRVNPTLHYSQFELKLERMSASTALFDLEKLNNVSKNIIASMSAEQVHEHVVEWARQNDRELAEVLEEDKSYAIKVFNVERQGPVPRKDLTFWADTEKVYGFLFDRFFVRSVENGYDFGNVPAAHLVSILTDSQPIIETIRDKDSWITEMRDMAARTGFAIDVKTYKKNPDVYKGHFGDIMMAVRVALTNSRVSPDLYEVIITLGVRRSIARISRALNYVKS